MGRSLAYLTMGEYKDAIVAGKRGFSLNFFHRTAATNEDKVLNVILDGLRNGGLSE